MSKSKKKNKLIISEYFHVIRLQIFYFILSLKALSIQILFRYIVFVFVHADRKINEQAVDSNIILSFLIFRKRNIIKLKILSEKS